MKPADIRFAGDDLLVFTLANLPERAVVSDQLRRTGHWLEVVPGREDISVQFDPLRMRPEEARAQLAEDVTSTNEASSDALGPVVLDVVFSAETGPELALCAEENDMSIEAFISRIVSSDLRVDMMGFTPGFAYVGGVAPDLKASRLEIPRQYVEAGSVGFISGSLGLYALPGPAGWPIIGKVITPLLDRNREPPILLRMGQPIRINLVSHGD